jgi:hypothetical protein
MTLRTIRIVIVNHGLRETITMRASAAVEMLGRISSVTSG